jgi:hypothetical protein
VYNFLKVCFYGEKLSIEVGYTMLKEFTDRLNDIVDVFDAENIILMFIMVIESGNVNFDQKHEILSLFNSAYYEKTIKYRDVWARLANSYYRVFEETYIKNKEIIYNNSYALHILRDYLDPSDEKILANTREVAERGLEEYHNYITYYWKAYKLDIPAIIPANLNIKEIEAEYAKIIMPFGKLMEISKRIKINIEPYEKILPSTDDHILDNNSLIRYKIRY